MSKKEDKLISLVDVQEEDRAEQDRWCREKLKDTIDRCDKSITSFAIVLCGEDGGLEWAHEANQYIQLIGGLEVLKYHLMDFSVKSNTKYIETPDNET